MKVSHKTATWSPHDGPPTTVHQRTHRWVTSNLITPLQLTGPETGHAARQEPRAPANKQRLPIPPRPLPLNPDPTRNSPSLRSGPRAATREAEEALRQRPPR